jgi:hypothetical protein
MKITFINNKHEYIFDNKLIKGIPFFDSIFDHGFKELQEEEVSIKKRNGITALKICKMNIEKNSSEKTYIMLLKGI